MSAPAPPSAPSPDTPSARGPTSYTDAFRGREAHTKFADPCEHARAESMKCLDKNSYDKTKCLDYRECKKQWLNQRRDDRRQGKDVA